MKNLEDYDPYQSNLYRLAWFEVLTYRETRFVVYGQGQWDGHLMDWAGGNYFHGRVPTSPVFATIEEAVLWLDEQVRLGNLVEKMTLSGHHAGGDGGCRKGCNARETLTVHFNIPTHVVKGWRKPGVNTCLDNTRFNDGRLRLPKRITGTVRKGIFG